MGIEAVFVGPIYASLIDELEAFDSKEKAKEHIEKNNLTDRLILLKGSRGIGLETLQDIL